jgi:hypothetical protein
MGTMSFHQIIQEKFLKDTQYIKIMTAEIVRASLP